MADLLLKREKGALDTAALRSQIAVFKAQRIKTCGHLLKLYLSLRLISCFNTILCSFRRKEYWTQLPLNETVRRALEDVMFDLGMVSRVEIFLLESRSSFVVFFC